MFLQLCFVSLSVSNIQKEIRFVEIKIAFEKKTKINDCALLLEGLDGPVEAGVAAEAGSEGRNEQGRGGQVLQQVGALADQQIHLVPAGGHTLVQRDPPQAGRFGQISVELEERKSVHYVPLISFRTSKVVQHQPARQEADLTCKSSWHRSSTANSVRTARRRHLRKPGKVGRKTREREKKSD